MVNSELENQAGNAILERLSVYTVAIDVSTYDSPNWGTGTLIKCKNRFFILTCSHVVTKDFPDNEIGVLFHSGGTSKFSTKEKILKTTLPELLNTIPNKSYRQTVEIINRFYSDLHDDLVLLELNPLSEQVKRNEFYDLSIRGIQYPQPDQAIYLAGFSEELARDLGKKRVGVLPYCDRTMLSTKQIESADFEPQREFLIVYTFNKDAVEPRGLSGCGVWVRLPSGKNVWTPNLYLVGVQKAVYRDSQVLVVTKAEVLLQMISAQIVPIEL